MSADLKASLNRLKEWRAFLANGGEVVRKDTLAEDVDAAIAAIERRVFTWSVCRPEAGAGMFDETFKMAESLKRDMGEQDGLTTSTTYGTSHLSKERINRFHAEVEAIKDVDVPPGTWGAVADLYEACSAALKHIDYIRNLYGDEGVTRTVADRLRAAVDKANGPGCHAKEVGR